MRRFLLVCITVTLCIGKSYCQEIRGFSTFDLIQYNPAYAGQANKNEFTLGAFLNSEHLKSEKERVTGTPQTYQFAYAADIPKFKSGVGFYSSLSGLGQDYDIKYGGIYNFNLHLSDSSN